MNLKNEKGFTVTDAIIAIVIIMLFVGVIVSISYNIYLQANFIKRNDTATNYIVELFEYAKELDFADVTYNTLSQYNFNAQNAVTVTNNQNEMANKGYTIFIEVLDINENFIKQVNVRVSYKLGNKTKTVTMSTLINK